MTTANVTAVKVLVLEKGNPKPKVTAVKVMVLRSVSSASPPTSARRITFLLRP
jgi:hypothetical protein